jgi:hypothetical protein
MSTFLPANTQAVRTPHTTITAAQNFALTDTNDLILNGGNAETVGYQGRKAVRLTNRTNRSSPFKGAEFQDGTIEADIAMKRTTLDDGEAPEHGK